MSPSIMTPMRGQSHESRTRRLIRRGRGQCYGRTSLTVAGLAFLCACGGSETIAPPTPTVVSVEVTPLDQSATAIGVTLQFAAVARDAAGAAVSTSFSWSSDDEGVATVTSSGMVTSTGNGTSQIRAMAQGVTGSATIHVRQEISQVTVSAAEVLLDRWGDTTRVVVEVADAAGTPVEGVQIGWVTSDAEIVGVDDSGLVTSGKAGVATLTWSLTLPASASLAVPARPNSVQQGLEGTVPARVELQRNSACVVPTEFPVRPPVGPMPNWVFDDTPLQGVPHWTNGTSANGDFDGDGDDDILAMEYMDVPPAGVGATRFWRNSGGVFEEATTEVLGSDPIKEAFTVKVEIVDFNGDGVVDVFKTQTGHDLSPYPGATNVLLLSQNGGTLRDVSETHVVPNVLDFSHGSSAADIDCDGDQDLIVTNHFSSSTPAESNHLYVNDGAGFLAAEDDRLPGWFARDRPVQKLEFCDLDRDGDSDLVAISHDDEDVVLVNDGFGRFRAAPVSLPAPPLDLITGHSLACTDLDLDGWPDLVIGHASNEQNAESFLSVWANRGGLVFEEVVLFEQQMNNNQLVRAVDINADGWTDLVRLEVEPTGSTGSSLLLNNGGTAFTPGPIPTYNLVDADGDGRLDAFRPGAPGLGDALFWFNR